MKDQYGRKINYLRISVTDLCNLKCRYCMPNEGIKKLPMNEILTLEEIEKIAKNFLDLGVDKIRITGGEPLIRKNILSLIRNLGKDSRLKDFSITTNGTNLASMATDLRKYGVNRINISLDTLDKEKYKFITKGGDLEVVKQGIKAALDAKLLPIKINVVLIKGFNEDEIENFAKLTMNEYIDVRFIELMPIGESKNWSEEKYLSNQIILKKLPTLKKVEGIDISSPAQYYKFENAKGKIGLINPISCKFCSNCNRVRLTAEGKLKLCLHSNEELDLKTFLREGKDIKKIIVNEIKNKPKEHKLSEGKYTKRNMFAIGG